jgi:hypothetical protein
MVYIAVGTLDTIALIVAVLALPVRIDKPSGFDSTTRWSWKERWRGFTRDIDWVGFLLQFATTGTLALSAIGLTWLSTELRKPLCISGVLSAIVLASGFVI